MLITRLLRVVIFCGTSSRFFPSIRDWQTVYQLQQYPRVNGIYRSILVQLFWSKYTIPNITFITFESSCLYGESS